jgi:hypothetical protein
VTYPFSIPYHGAAVILEWRRVSYWRTEATVELEDGRRVTLVCYGQVAAYFGGCCLFDIVQIHGELRGPHTFVCEEATLEWSADLEVGASTGPTVRRYLPVRPAGLPLAA